MMLDEYDPMDMPDDRTYRYAVLIEVQEGRPMTVWRDDSEQDANLMADTFDTLIRDRQRQTGQEPCGMPMSVVDYFAHLKDES